MGEASPDSPGERKAAVTDRFREGHQDRPPGRGLLSYHDYQLPAEDMTFRYNSLRG